MINCIRLKGRRDGAQAFLDGRGQNFWTLGLKFWFRFHIPGHQTLLMTKLSRACSQRQRGGSEWSRLYAVAHQGVVIKIVTSPKPHL